MARGKKRPATVVQGHEKITKHPDGTVVVDSPDATKTVKPPKPVDPDQGKKELLRAAKCRAANMPGKVGSQTRGLVANIEKRFLAAAPGTPEHDKCERALLDHLHGGTSLIGAWTAANAE